MKRSVSLLAVILFFLASLAPGYPQEYGKVRALQQRAEHIVKLKNDFVASVLTAYRIPHERNAQGMVVRINIDDRWLEVATVEIVPVVTETADKKGYVTAHEVLFTTAGGTLDLLSDMAIR
jgi:hypothetical protein